MYVGRRGAWMEAERGMYVPLGGACSGDNVHLDRERRSRGTEPRASKGVSTPYKRVVESSRARGRKLPQRELKNTVAAGLARASRSFHML